MIKPSFHKPLLKLDHQLIGMMNHTRALTAQVRALNVDAAGPLEQELIDLTATLLDAQQHLIAARRLEQKFRTN